MFPTTHRRYLMIALLISAAMFLCLCLPRPGVMTVYRSSPAPMIAQLPVAAAPDALAPKAAIKKAPAPAAVKFHPKAVSGPTEFWGVPLNRFSRLYTTSFSGKVTCAGQPCQATLDVVVDTQQNPDVHRSIETQPDGTFSLDVPITEAPHEQLDWRIVASAPTLGRAEARGHHILVEERVVEIDKHLDLQ